MNKLASQTNTKVGPEKNNNRCNTRRFLIMGLIPSEPRGASPRTVETLGTHRRKDSQEPIARLCDSRLCTVDNRLPLLFRNRSPALGTPSRATSSQTISTTRALRTKDYRPCH